jgi:hypothetical protein
MFGSIQKNFQFQLTVNIVAFSIALEGAFIDSESPMSVVQMIKYEIDHKSTPKRQSESIRPSVLEVETGGLGKSKIEKRNNGMSF